MDVRFYNYLEATSEACFGALVHNGDNRDGVLDGVDELITLFLFKFNLSSRYNP